MPTMKPRVSVTLSPRLHAVIVEMASLTGNSQSALIGELLEQSRSTFERMVRVLRAAVEARVTIRQVVSEQVLGAHQKIEELLALDDHLSPEELGQLDLLESVERVEARGAAAGAAKRSRKPAAASQAPKDPLALTGGSHTPKRRANSKKATREGGHDAAL